MEDFVKTLNLTSEGEIPEKLWSTITESFGSKEGVSCKKVEPDQIIVSYFSYQYSPEYILDIVNQAGFREKEKVKISLWKRLFGSIDNDADRSFSTRRLDCCSLNRNNQAS